MTLFVDTSVWSLPLLPPDREDHIISTDNHFKLAAPHCALRVWAPKMGARRK